MSRIFFIRHGQASFGNEDYDRLSEAGRRQSSLLACYFERVNLRFDAVYTGTLRRHRETADALLSLLGEKGIPVPPVNRLEELDEYPTAEIFRALVPVAIDKDPRLGDDVARLMTDRRAFQKVFENVMGLWTSGAHDVQGLTTWREFYDTVNRAIDTIMWNDGSGKTVAVFTSGGPISAAVMRVLGLSGSVATKMAEQLVNSSFTRFKCTQDRIMMATFNEYPHLESENDGDIITYR